MTIIEVLAFIGALALSLISLLLLAIVIENTRNWLRSTTFGQATKPIRGIIPADRLLSYSDRAGYYPYWACIGTAKLSIGFLFIAKRKKTTPPEST